MTKLKPVIYKGKKINVIKYIDGRGRSYDVYDVKIGSKVYNTHAENKPQAVKLAKLHIDGKPTYSQFLARKW